MKVNNVLPEEEKLAVEARLVALCKAQGCGWQQELSAWLVADARWLHRRCVYRLGNEADAEDAVQEITVKVLNAIGRFEERSKLRSWVTRIADNHCNTVLKRRYANVMTDHLQHCITVHEQERSAFTNQDQCIEAAFVKSSVKRTLNHLSEKNQEVLRLRFDADLSLNDMAALLNLSLSATKMRLYRAQADFKKKYVLQAA